MIHDDSLSTIVIDIVAAAGAIVFSAHYFSGFFFEQAFPSPMETTARFWFLQSVFRNRDAIAARRPPVFAFRRALEIILIVSRWVHHGSPPVLVVCVVAIAASLFL